MNVQPDASSVSPSDLLSSLLREVRFESAAYRWLELGAPFRVGFDHPGLRGVHLITQGECDLVLDDGETVRLTAGDLVILPLGDAHFLRSPGTPAASTVSGFELAARSPGHGLRAGGPVVDTTVMCGAFLIGVPDHPAMRVLPRTVLIPGVDGLPQPWLAPLVDAVHAEAAAGEPGSDLVMARLSDALLIKALRHYSGTVADPGWLTGLRDPQIGAALAAIHTDPARRWTLTTLARTAGLSRSAFAARFHHRVGEPAMRYLLAVRMQRAKTLLESRALTVAAVATQVGYQSEQAFAAAYKRETGTTPGAHRLGRGR